MIQPLLALVLSTGQLPVDPKIPTILEGREVTTVVQATRTHFAAWNLTCEVQWLLVGDPELGVLETQPLHPGQRIQHSLGIRDSEGLTFEIVRLDEIPPSGSGMTSVETLRSTNAGVLWLEASEQGTTSWQQGADGTCFARPNANSWVPGTNTISLHVPGAPPRPAGGDKPPVVREKPLPPV